MKKQQFDPWEFEMQPDMKIWTLKNYAFVEWWLKSVTFLYSCKFFDKILHFLSYWLLIYFM